MYTLTNIKTLREAVEVLKQFEKTSLFYWINKLTLKDSQKGFLVVYFNLV